MRLLIYMYKKHESYGRNNILDCVPWLCKSWDSEIGSGIDLDLCKLVERLLL